ncbi:MAG TPA: aminoacyl-tRNA hydrolase [Clostridiaceae bacterium]
MYLIVGLGNPGDEYKGTRHNAGYDVIDLIASKYNISINRIKFKGVYGEGSIENNKIILIKPITYMNLSGECISEWVNFYKIPISNIIIIYDDISLEMGRLRIRSEGSAGGHNGIKNIIERLGVQVFNRIRIGVGAPKGELVSYVLGKFSRDEKELISKTYKAAGEAVEIVLSKGTYVAMNSFNSFKA